MPQIYTPSKNTDPTKAILGEKSGAVLALQKQLNQQNAGVTGYVPLKEDSLYGPLTQAASQFKAPVSSPIVNTPTIQSTNPLYTESPEEKALKEATQSKIEYYKTNANSIIDENQIRADTLAQMQAEINAQNDLYANKLREAKIAGQGRLGSNVAIQGRSGLLGSDFGATQTSNINAANSDIEASINAEKAAAVSALLTKARDSGTATIAAKRAAKEAGLTEYINSLSTATEMNKKRANDVAKLIISGKLDFEKDKNVIEQAAKDSSLTVTSLKSAYDDQLKTQKAEQSKLEKEARASLPASIQEYEYAKGKGYNGTYSQYQNEDANRKAKISRADGFSSANINSTINSIAGSFDNEPIVKNFNIQNEGYQFAKSLSNDTKNPSDDQGLIYAFAKAMDPNSVVREGEYATVQKYSQSLLDSYGKSVLQAINGTGFLTPEARTNIKKTIETKVKASKANYDNVKSEYQKRIDKAAKGGGNSLTDYGAAYNEQVPTNNISQPTQNQPQSYTLPNGTVLHLQDDGTYN